MKHLRYTIIIEKSKNGYGAYVLDLPGCAVVGKSKSEVIKLIKKGIEYHLEQLVAGGDKIPLPNSETMQITVEVA